MSRCARRASVVALALASAPLAGCAWTRAALYDPERDEARAAPPDAAPGEAPIEEVSLASDDGTRLHARLLRCPGATRALLLCHGTGGNVAHYTGLARELRDLARAHVLVFDYRGYGRSEGEPTEEGLEADARAALEELALLTSVPRERTVCVGHSLGGAVAIDLAARREGLAGLCVLSTFSSIEDMCRHLALLSCLVDLVPDPWESRAAVRAVACPKLFLHGGRDHLVPREQAERLYAAAPPPKRLVVLPESGHELLSHEGALAEVAAFCNEVAPEPSAIGPSTDDPGAASTR